MEQLSNQLSLYFWSLKKWEAHIQTVVIPTPFTYFECKYPQIKAESLQLKHILFHFKSIVVLYKAKNIRIVSMPQYLWTRLFLKVQYITKDCIQRMYLQ